MSWQRILESARRLGTPVIVTDIAGREPMVVMPFEQYDRLMEGSSRKETPSVPRSALKEDKIMLEERMDSVQTPASQEGTLPSIAAIPPQEMGELTLEERFYLEPVDESQNS